MTEAIDVAARGDTQGCLVKGASLSWVPEGNICLFAEGNLHSAPICALKWLELVVGEMERGTVDPNMQVGVDFMLNISRPLKEDAKEKIASFLGNLNQGTTPDACQWCTHGYTDADLNRVLKGMQRRAE